MKKPRENGPKFYLYSAVHQAVRLNESGKVIELLIGDPIAHQRNIYALTDRSDTRYKTGNLAPR